MRKLLRRVAASAGPIVAVALFAGCQQEDSSASSDQANSNNTVSPSVTEQSTAPNIQHIGQVEQAQSLEEVAELCGFKCNTLAEGSASISGIRSVDAFFSAVLTLQTQSTLLEGEVKATLGEMAAALGLTVEANAKIEDISAAIAAEIDGGFGGKIDGGVTASFEPAKCSVTAKASVEAAAKCDVKVDPGKVEVECKGECQAEASAMAECSGEVKCTGTAPSFACEGSCQGECELDATAKCEGSCKGSCELDGSVACDGECAGSTDAGGNCTGECKVRSGGKCEGECKGTCELSAGATCTGKCKGECTYDPPAGGCTGKASCKASADASVKCSGECKGEVEPPMVEAECQATAKAEAEFNAECTPPSVALDYNFSAEFQAEVEADASAEAAFAARLEAFAKAYGNLLAKGARVEGIVKATGGLVAAGEGAVKGVVSGLTASGDLHVAFNASCAIAALGDVKTSVEASAGSLQKSVSAIGSITASLGG